MSRVLFAPFSIIGSLLAGLAARKLFDRVWALIDDEEPPEAGEEAETIARVLLAAVLQAAVFAGSRVRVRPPGAASLPRPHGVLAGPARQDLSAGERPRVYITAPRKACKARESRLFAGRTQSAIT